MASMPPVVHDDHDTDRLLESLLVHPREELVGFVPIDARDRCSRCERPADDLVDRAHGERVCGACRQREMDRYEAETGECWHGCGYELAWHVGPRTTEAPCPTEAEARKRSGSH